MSKEDVLLFSSYGMRCEGKSYYEKLKEKNQEIERLNNIIKKGITEEMKDELDVILKTNQKQAYRINKAIEYIENDLSHATSNGKLHRKHLLDILKGVDKE